MSQHLLIIACSQRKRATPGLLPAIERYDGVNYRVLRKARREGHWPANLDLLILSARFGLLKSTVAIPNYDLRMTKPLAIALRSSVEPMLVDIVTSVAYTEIFLNLGKDYLLAIGDWQTVLHQQTNVICARGGIGQKAAQMRQWLVTVAKNARET